MEKSRVWKSHATIPLRAGFLRTSFCFTYNELCIVYRLSTNSAQGQDKLSQYSLDPSPGRMCSSFFLSIILAWVQIGQIIKCQNYQFTTGPPDKSPDTWRLWWAEFTLWRSEIAATLNLSNYDLEQVSWAKTSFIQPQVNDNPDFARSLCCL